MSYVLATKRLILRQWRDSDYSAFARLNADSHAMRYFPATLSQQESDSLADRIRNMIDVQGWGLWATVLKSTGEFIGFVGLNDKDGQSGIPHAPLTEIGWRLLPEHWGKGYAPEAAESVLRFAFEQRNLPEVYAFTTLSNQPSQRVMCKIGMHNTGDDFDHPQVAPEHPLVRHCLYKMTQTEWRQRITSR
ncbi:GNAT family N-acetyltransferase [Vibrio mangrovi]|uniref:Anhydro-N-acetylmuramic acid kinase n=1 Tax=Vibrio mangrovi TaxID=474394 RepID=A0A1Y6IX54_9VIBR|nr:GNAT family N-acetyltransferase [Vibrio mangrovi]MDW6004781.1 GNAT family N-acetyltransferase [Vibrio mangrovi]SMS01072.1 anhydro-N-acetylmuramic acid kinase [Vibrio mangrovi]